MLTFGELLNQAIEKKRLQKQDVAKHIGVDPSYLAKMISGERNPPNMAQFESLVDYLGLDKDDRLDFYMAAIEKKTPDRIRPFISAVRELSSDTLGKGAYFKNPMHQHQFDKVEPVIPIVKIPDTKLKAPYPKEEIVDYYMNNEIINEGFYAIRANLLPNRPPEFGRHDLLIVNPYYPMLKSKDYVLVRLQHKTFVKQISLLQVEQKKFIQFLPMDKLCLSPMPEEPENGEDPAFSIYGKIVFAIKRY